MDCDRMLQQIAETRISLFAEGHLDKNFYKLEKYEKEFKMDFFAEEVLNSFFELTAKVLRRVEQELEKVPLDLEVVMKLISQLKHYCISVGAANVRSKVIELAKRIAYGVILHIEYSYQDALREVMLERERFKSKMELYFRMRVWDPPSVIDDDPGFEDGESTDEE